MQEDVACSGRQAEAAQQSSDSWQQTVQHLRAELDRGEHDEEGIGMQAEVRLLHCSFHLFASPARLTAMLAQHTLYLPLHPFAGHTGLH